jgi:hypothetical protein
MMQGKVALEEHFALPETVQDSAGFVPGDYWVELKARLLDMQDRRLREMDANGIEMMLPSLNAPAVQAIPDRRQAIEIARRANDFLAGEIAKRTVSRAWRRYLCRIQTLPPVSWGAAWATSAFAVHWSTASAKWTTLQTPHTTTCRNTVRSGQRWNG